MFSEVMRCPDCQVWVADERSALLHECGVVVPGPEMAPEPKTLADVVEAIEGLALQVNGIGMSAKRAADAMERFVQIYSAGEEGP